MKQKKFLPIGIQDFRDLRERNCIYVDKTDLIYTLCTEAKHYFLARPRRFGKSLLLSTIKYLYSDEKQTLFKGLKIERQLDQIKTLPTIHLSLASDQSQIENLKDWIGELLDFTALQMGIEPYVTNHLDIKLAALINNAAKLTKHDKVILLVDEFDSPIVNQLGNKEKLKEAIAILRSLFNSVKNLDHKIELSFFTGITNVGKLSYFSTLNHLNNISQNAKFANICGYTHDDIDLYFTDYLQDLAATYNFSLADAKTLLFKWYNGYSWDGKNLLLIPFSVLVALSRLSVETIWAEGVTIPGILIDFFKQNQFNLQEIQSLEEITLQSSIFQELDIENLSIKTFLLQTGFLTIKDKNLDGSLRVGYPNLEVKQAISSAISSAIFSPSIDIVHTRAYEIAHTVMSLHTTRDIAPLAKILSSLFASIPHQLLQHKRESLYHSALYIIFYLASLQVDAEVSTSNGRADVIIHTEHSNIILECKYEKSAAVAVKQIFDKKYYAPYLTDGKQIIAIGCNFTDAGLELAAEFIG